MIRIGDFRSEKKYVDAVLEVIKSGRITEGPKVAELEKVMAEYLGVENAILVTNGTVALQLLSLYLRTTLSSSELNVIVPALTFPATINAFAIENNSIAMCDVGVDLTIDLTKLDDETKRDANVVVPVHLMGYSANMDVIMAEAKKYGWIVIEDACEAFGAEYKGKKVGTIGDFGCFSFYVSHNITAGELGMIVTNDSKAAKILRSMKNHGRTGDSMQFNHDYIGSNYKTNEFCAAIALENMKDVDSILKIRKDNCRYYHDNIKNDDLTLYPVPEGYSPLGYTIGCKSEKHRKEVCDELNKNDIETRYMFPCLANQGAYNKTYKFSHLPTANFLEKHFFYIGCHQYLSQKDKEKVVKILNGV